MKWKQNGVDFSALCLTVLWGVEVTSSRALGVLAAVKREPRAEKFSKKIFDTLPRIQITSQSEFIDSETASSSSIRCRALFALTKRDEFFMNFSEQINAELVNALP